MTETRNPQGQLHSYNDKPAKRWDDGTKFWYKKGKRHRGGDLPAVIDADGSKFWYKNGELHRDGDQPAVIWANGGKNWYKNDIEYYPDFRKILRSITDEEKYVKFLSEHPELRTKPVNVVRHRRKRTIVKQHKRTKPRKR